jgi:hypothetical protein
VDPLEDGISYAQWKADQLNRIFQEHGALKEPAKITADTVQDGLDKLARRNYSNKEPEREPGDITCDTRLAIYEEKGDEDDESRNVSLDSAISGGAAPSQADPRET